MQEGSITVGRAYDAFREKVGIIFDLDAASAVLEWDQQTCMPGGGTEGRSLQYSTLQRLSHEHFVSPAFHQALQAASDEVANLDPDSDEARTVRHVRRKFDKATRVPSEWVGEFNRVKAMAMHAWEEAKAQSNFARFEPDLTRVVQMRRDYAAFFAPYDHVYDPLLDDYEPGMKTSEVKAVFDHLRPAQVALVQEISAHGHPVDDSVLRRAYDEGKQWIFSEEIARCFGYDFNRGRQDKSAHPFTISFGHGDVRITTRVVPDYLPFAMFSTMHEAGHAMYEQGLKPALNRTLTATGASMGMHESQSRMWENLVGRSRPFWQAFYPDLQALFPGQLGKVEMEAFYRAVNKVEPSLIRTEADEATYNLHVMLRFELEIALMQGALTVRDLPDAWNEKYREYLGIAPPDDAQGVLQDIHWSDGYFGYFPTYTLGNLIASQLWEKIRQDLPDLDQSIAAKDFQPLLAWLRTHIHQHGAKFEPMELLERVTGQRLTAEPYLAYLRSKFGEIYAL
jgi:carboxypeptidase Taq